MTQPLYNFHKLAVGQSFRVRITDDDPKAGSRARLSAYQFGRRHGRQFSGVLNETRAGRSMVITRIA